MITQKTKMLLTTLKKFYDRKATSNIKRILKKAHSAEIAEALENFPFNECLEIFKMEAETKKKAELLSHLNSNLQNKILTHLPKKEITLLVQSMDSDDAADILGALPKEQSSHLLSSMKKEDSRNVSELMGYPEDSAGGLMNANVFSLHQNLSVKSAIDSIEENKEQKQVYYIYVVNDSGHLIGVVSLKQLLLAQKKETLKSIMHSNVISVTLDTKQEEVAIVVEKYDFLALPIVDANNKLMGVITVDDVIDVIREETEGELLAMGSAGWDVNPSTFSSFKARFPLAFLSFLSGLVGFMILFLFYFIKQKGEGPRSEDVWKTLVFLPIFLNLGGVIGSQASMVAAGAIRGGFFKTHSMMHHLKKELFLSFIFSLLFSGCVYLVGKILFSEFLNRLLSLSLVLQIMMSVVLGNTLPLLFHKWGLNTKFASVPLFYASVINIFSTLVLLGFLYSFL